MGRKGIEQDERFPLIKQSLIAHNMKEIAKIAEECNCSTTSVMKVKKIMESENKLNGYSNVEENFLKNIGKMIDLAKYIIKSSDSEEIKEYFTNLINSLREDLNIRQHLLDNYASKIES